MRNDFAIFILTHGRPKKQLTLNALLKAGYSGKYYLVLDDTDNTIQDYIDEHGTEHIIVFDKNHYINTVATSMSKPYYKCILYAKCAAEDIAVDMGLKCFVVCDDDLLSFTLRVPEGDILHRYKISNIDDVFEAYADFVINNKTTLVGIGHGGTYFAGVSVLNSSEVVNLGSPYNFIFRNTECPVEWVSAYGEDDVTNTLNAIVGKKVFVLPQMQLEIVPSGSCSEAGMQEVYVNNDRFKLMFFIFMHNPTSINLVIKKDKLAGYRWDIQRNTKNSRPRIISPIYKKQNM